jgi:DNA-binding transcriptional LysR family regulator
VGLDLFKLLVFVTVVDRRGYSAAAEHLSLSQATVSFHVHSLERQLGVPLVRYEHRAVHLTAMGEQVYRSARLMLREEQRLTRSLRSGRSGQVRLGASIAFEQAFFIEKVIAPFHRGHPDMLLSVRFGHSVRLARDALDHEIDLAYLIGWHVPSGLRYERLHDATFTFLVARQHPLARRESVSVADVARAGLIAAPLDEVESAHYGEVLHDVGLSAADIVLEIDGIQARVLAAQAGLGVLGTFYPGYAGIDASGALIPLRLDRPCPTVDVGLASRRADPPSPAVEVLADWLRDSTRA